MNQPTKIEITHETKAQARPSLREVAVTLAKIPGAALKAVIGKDSFTKQVVKDGPKNKAIVDKYKAGKY